MIRKFTPFAMVARLNIRGGNEKPMLHYLENQKQ